MKSTINEPLEKIMPFPKLMIQHSSGTIILAAASEGLRLIGMQVSTIPSENFNHVAHYDTSWCASEFVDFEGSITLSND